MIDRFARALRLVGIDTDAVQLAEILWVATRRTGETMLPTQREEPPDRPESATTKRPIVEQDSSPLEPESGTEPLLHLVPAGPSAGEALEVQLPGPIALPGRLRIARALRAFKRRYPVSRFSELDLDATIELYGETGLLVPLRKPGSERWFDVTLVVDAGPTMDVWMQTTTELARLLSGHGAFRRVRRLRLVDDEGQPTLLADSGRYEHLRRAGGRDERHLIMVISDCVGVPWYRDTLWQAIRDWGKHGPVVLVQPLPPRLWESTALGPADAKVTSYRPGQPNSGLRITLPWWSTSEDEGTGVLPVVGLTEPELARWARMVMGGADVPIAGVLAEVAYDEPATTPPMSAAARVAAFKATVSVEAYQLAVCLAAVPIRLPVARIVQYAVLDSRDPVHLAEVFAGGLIRRITPAAEELPTDEVVYDFSPGVREVLQGSLTGSRTLEIFRAVARYLEQIVGSNTTFAALLTGATSHPETNPAIPSFADVGRPLLDRLGLTDQLGELGRRQSAASTSKAVEPHLPLTEPRGVVETPAPAFAADEVFLGRNIENGREFRVPLMLLRKHTVIFAGSGSGKTVLLRRLVEDAALHGVSSILIDSNNDLGRLGDPWPSPPATWASGDAERAERYFADTDVVIWTPLRETGRPLGLNPWPDLSGMLDDPDEFRTAVDVSVAGLVRRAGLTARKVAIGKAVLTEALTHFARRGGSELVDFVELLGDLPDGVSTIRDARQLAVDMAAELKAARINDPIFGGAGERLDPGVLLTPPADKRARISVISCIGLPTDEQRQTFVNQLQLALFAWVKQNPAGDRPLGGLLVLDEAQTFVPSRGTTASTESTLKLATQARKYGLGMVYATQAPKALHNVVIGNAATQFIGLLNASVQIQAAMELARSKGGRVDDISRLSAGRFYGTTEGMSMSKIQVPMCLSHHPASALTEEEVIVRASRFSRGRLRER